MGSARGPGYVAIILFLVAAAFSHWTWINGADVQLPGLTNAYSYDFKLGPLQPNVQFGTLGAKPAAKQGNSWQDRAQRVAGAVGSAVVGEATGSRAYLWGGVINGVDSYSDLNKKICAGDYTAMVKTVALQAFAGTNDCGTTHTLQYLAIGSMLFLGLACLFAILGLVQHFTGKIISYNWENVFAFSIAACCALVMLMQVGAAMAATGLMFKGRWFKFIPYFGMLWNIVAFVLSFVLVSPCCSGRKPLLEKGDEEEQGAHTQGQYEQGQYMQGQHQQGGQYGAHGQGYGYGGQGQYSQPQQPQYY